MRRQSFERLAEMFWDLLDRADGLKKPAASRKSADGEGEDAESGASGSEPKASALDSFRQRITKLGATKADDIIKVPAPIAKVGVLYRESRVRRKAKKEARKLVTCPTCGRTQTPPAVFCDECQESFLNVGAFSMLTLTSIALTCFFAAEYYRDSLSWPAPLYIFFSIGFLYTNVSILKRSYGLIASTLAWCSTFLVAGGLYYHFGPKVSQDFLLAVLHTTGSFLAEQWIALAILGFGLLAGALILIGWMASKYSLTQAYRIVILYAAMAAIGIKFVYPHLLEIRQLERALDFMDADSVRHLLDLLFVNLLRVLTAELIVMSMVKSIRPAHEAFIQKKVLPKPASKASAGQSADHLVESLYRVAISLANTFTRFYLQIEHTFLALGTAAIALVRALGDFTWMLIRDLLIPVAALTLAAFGLHKFAVDTDIYMTERRYSALLGCTVASGLIFIGQFSFLCSRTRLAPQRLLASTAFVMQWLSPYLLILFVFVSGSLYALGLALSQWQEDAGYRYRVGPLTFLGLILIVAIMIFAVLKRHRSESPESPVGSIED